MGKRIALITTRKEVVSGVTVFMDLLKKELEKNGFEVGLIYPISHSFEHMTSISSILGYGLAREELKNYDLVIGNGIGLTGAVDLDIKIIDNIHSTSPGANRCFEQAFSILTETEKVWLNHVLGPLMGQKYEDIPGSLTAKQNAFEVDKIAAQRADAIITVSPGTRREVIDFFDIGEKEVKAVPNGIDSKWFEEREYQDAINESPVNVIYTGRAGYTTINIFWKGFDRTLAVLKNVKNAQTIGVFHLGMAKTRDIYKNLLDEANIRHFFDIENSILPTFLRAGDIYIQTSRYEACSLSIMEAMASGLAPVAFPSGMNDIQIQNGKNGFIVHSIEEMNERIDQLIADPELRIGLGKEAARTIREEYSVEKMISGYLTVINKLLS